MAYMILAVPRRGQMLPLSHARLTSLSTCRISSWIRPFDATTAGALRSTSAPAGSVTRPPASSTNSMPAATSQGPSLSSQ